MPQKPRMKPARPGEDFLSFARRNEPWTHEKCAFSGIQACHICIEWACCDNINPAKPKETDR